MNLPKGKRIDPHLMGSHSVQLVNYKELSNGSTLWITRNPQERFLPFDGKTTFSDAYLHEFLNTINYYQTSH